MMQKPYKKYFVSDEKNARGNDSAESTMSSNVREAELLWQFRLMKMENWSFMIPMMT